MAHVSEADARAWMAAHGIKEKSVEDGGLAASTLAPLLETYPGLTLAELKQLSTTNPRALVGANGSTDGPAPDMTFHDWALAMLSQYGQGNNTLTFFVDTGGALPFKGIPNGNVGINTNQFNSQRTLTPSTENVEFIRQTMANYGNLTGGTLKFVEVSEDDQAAISFYYSPAIPTGKPNEYIAGMSTGATNGKFKWRNVFYNDGKSDQYAGSGEDFIKNTIVHEMGHTIGFRHPVDLATDRYGQDGLAGNGYNSVYNDHDTIMSYNRNLPYSTRLTEADEHAYEFFWGPFSGSVDLAGHANKDLHKADVFGESTTSNGGRPSGLASLTYQDRDFITGSSRGDWYVGDQSDDTWHGGDGDDNYIYKGGFDFASGQDGKDTFYIDPLNENGYLTINDFTAGQDRLVFQSDDDYSIFSFGGATFVLGSDTDKVVFLKGEFTEQQLLGNAGAQLGIA